MLAFEPGDRPSAEEALKHVRPPETKRHETTRKGTTKRDESWWFSQDFHVENVFNSNQRFGKQKTCCDKHHIHDSFYIIFNCLPLFSLSFLLQKTKAWFLVKSNALPQRPVTFDITTCNLANRGNEQMRDMNKKWTANEDRLNKLLPRWAFGRSIEICWVLKRSKLQDWTVRKAAGLTHWPHHGPHSPVTQQFEEITVVTTSGREAAKSDEDHDYFGISCPALHVGILRNWIKQIQCRLLQLLQAHLMLAVVRSVAQAVSTFNRFQSVSDS